jgi:long-chain fatty acid transport protein
MKPMARKLVPLAVGTALAALAGGASSSGFQLMEQNASGLGNAYAGQAAAAEDASTVFWNPAGLTRLPGKQVVGALNLVKPSSEFNDSGASRSPLGQPLGPGGGSGGDAGDLAAIPNLYASWQLSPQLWLGLGVTVPFGLKTEYDPGWIGRFQGQLAEIKTVDINPSIAYKINDTVSIGVGVSYQTAEATVNRSVLLTGPVEGFTSTKIDDDAFGYNLGVMFNLSPSTRIGLSYRSSMDYKLAGTLGFTGVPVVGTASNNVQMDAELPDTWSVAFAHQLNPQWEILGDVTFTQWSKIKSLPLVTTSASPVIPASGVTADTFNFQFKDTYRVGVGANYKWHSDFMWKFGVAYDKSPVEDEFRTVTLPDNDRTWLAFGGKYRMSKQATLDFGYAHLFIKDAPINQLRGVGVPPFQGNVVGTYEADVNILSAQISYSF